MSISSAFSNALSGLTASSRAADVVSSNISNSMTDGYGVRQLDVASRIIENQGGGVRVIGVTRLEDAPLTGSRRLADADLAARQVRADALGRIETAIGTPDEVDSLSARSAAFEASLIAAANAPQNEAGLESVADAAVALANKLNSASRGVQDERLRADNGIADAVSALNSGLEALSDLNKRILRTDGLGQDISALLDAQAKIVDDIAPLLPITTRRDTTNALQVFSLDGNALLDSRAARFEFTGVAIVAAGMTQAANDLSGLTVNGRAIDFTGPTASFQGGKLAALFDMRDRTGVGSQERLDAVARDLAERFQNGTFDPTLPVGAPALFTDGGAVVTAVAETGLAARIGVNQLVDPAQTGETWRLRDGLGAAAVGPPARSDILNGQIAVLSTPVATASAAFSNAGRSFAALISDNLSMTGIARQDAETSLAGIAIQQAALRQSELGRGVDTDAEMQRLLQIENSFAANARVVTAASDMLDEILRIGR